MGFVTPITLQSLFGNKRMIGSLTVNVILNEETTDILTITKQPVQTGAAITDHSFQEPTVLTMSILQQDNSIEGIFSTFAGSGAGGLAQIYTQFQQLQSSRTPFNVLTPKRIYQNMLMNSLRCITDKKTENILALNCAFQQIILVSVGTARVPASSQKNPASNQAIQSTGQQSFLSSAAQAISGGSP